MKIILLILEGLFVYLIFSFPLAVLMGRYLKKVREREESFWLREWVKKNSIWLEWPRDAYQRCSLEDCWKIFKIIETIKTLVQKNLEKGNISPTLPSRN